MLQYNSFFLQSWLKFQSADSFTRNQWCSQIIFIEFETSQSHKPFESDSSEIFSSRVNVESWLARVKSDSIHKNCRVTWIPWFASSSQIKFHTFRMSFFAMKWRPKCYKMAPGKFDNGAQHAIKWCPISYKMVTNVVLARSIAGDLYLRFLWKRFALYTCLFHSQSFQQVYHNIAASVATKGVRKGGGVGIDPPPWAWYFTKTLLPSQGD